MIACVVRFAGGTVTEGPVVDFCRQPLRNIQAERNRVVFKWKTGRNNRNREETAKKQIRSVVSVVFVVVVVVVIVRSSIGFGIGVVGDWKQ